MNKGLIKGKKRLGVIEETEFTRKRMKVEEEDQDKERMRSAGREVVYE